MSFIFFNGTFSHAIKQIPALGDFRVQYIHGGSVQRVSPEPWMAEEANRILAIIQKLYNGQEPLLYARIDMVQRDNKLCDGIRIN